MVKNLKSIRVCSTDFPSISDPESSSSLPNKQPSLPGSHVLLLCIEVRRCVYVHVYPFSPLFFIMVRHVRAVWYLPLFNNISYRYFHICEFSSFILFVVVVVWNCSHLTSLIASLLMGILPCEVSALLPL